MPSNFLRSRLPTGDAVDFVAVDDPDVLASYLSDAAHFPGGHTRVFYAPGSEAAVAAILRRHPAVLPIGAQSSLTGGATPMGEVLLSTRRLKTMTLGADAARVEAGVTLIELDARLAKSGQYYPPVPTFAGACVGGIVATNAAGAATFKYGTTRNWVRALTVVLPCGDVLDLERGAIHAHPDGYFELALTRGMVRVPVPSYRMPQVPKLSAGLYAAPGMDLIDLFIGAEGTLGIVTEVTLRVLPQRPAFCLALVTFDTRAGALRFVEQIRNDAIAGWRGADPHALDVSAIEHMDARCLSLLREDGADRINGVVLPPDAAVVLLLTIELASETTGADAFEQLGSWDEAGRDDTPLRRLCARLAEHGVLERVQLAVPGDARRAGQLLNLREAVPSGVNRRVSLAKEKYEGLRKIAADIIVPFERTSDLMAFCDDEFARRGLDGAVWGHISDGNLHPNVIPRVPADLESGNAAVLACGREAIRLGGAPLGEHGVGRNPVKQRLLIEMYGSAGVDEMRNVKHAVDPGWKLAPGVLFAR
jgi:D-lactate dehydrogenase (cytochrome)